MFIIPIVDGDVEENNYKLSIYLADLTDDTPLATLVTEDMRQTVFFNEDESAIYLSKEGGLENTM